MIPLSLRLAGRELRAGVRGFRIFLACLALGVAAIAAAGSTAEAFRRGLTDQAGEILGGDLAATVEQRRFSPEEIAALDAEGPVSVAVNVRAMAEAASGERRLVEWRGVSETYPLKGQVTLQGAPDLASALAPRGGLPGAAVEQDLLDRLGIGLGDSFQVGNVRLTATAVLLEEPDRLSRGFALGPRVVTALQVVEGGGLLAAGLPFVETRRLVLPPEQTPGAAQARLEPVLGDDVRIRVREEAAPGARWLIDQLEYFLAFIGLASLLAGGLGVQGAVSAFLEARRPSIAILKALGASAVLVRNAYLVQISILALLGIGIGLVLGAASPFVLGGLLPADLPVPALFAVYPEPLWRAAGFGALCAAAFALVPLARARATSPASLFRRQLQGHVPLGVELVVALLAAAGLAALAFLTAPTPLTAAIMIAGVAAAFLILWALGLGSASLAGRLRRLARGPVRIGLANLSGPRSAARTAAPAIGLGVALLATVVLIQSSLLRQVAEVAPQTAPALVFTEIPGEQADAFEAVVAQAFGRTLTPDDWLRMPMLTGRIVRVKGVPVAEAQIAKGEDWAFDNDISMTLIGPEPQRSGVVEGAWWDSDVAQPQIALEADAARAARLKPGDQLTLSVLGREIEVRLAALREVDFGGFGPSFAVILSPSTVPGVPLRQVAIAKATPEEEARVLRALAADFAEVNVISVREQLEAATALFDRLALAVRAAAAVAALAGLLVLAGAIAAGAQARAREAAVLKVLGASRGQILGAYGMEYASVGLIAGAIGVALGVAAAWPVITLVFKSDWAVDWAGVAALVAGVAALTGLGGLAAAFQALARRPAATLRAE